ncbi:MAG: hypothetical protein JJ878_00570 [Alphaproteobacteria bacterium]|nr:hypothetical protein [Alphaproteobacteria bacterium]MBO6861097.1 hypothetical protein [Alphaproteobacteria bacterium]
MGSVRKYSPVFVSTLILVVANIFDFFPIFSTIIISLFVIFCLVLYFDIRIARHLFDLPLTYPIKVCIFRFINFFIIGHNPFIVLEPPREKYLLEWDAPEYLAPVTRPDPDLKKEIDVESRIPSIILNNISDFAISNVHLFWNYNSDVTEKETEIAFSNFGDFHIRIDESGLFYRQKSEPDTHSGYIPHQRSALTRITLVRPSLDKDNAEPLQAPFNFWSKIESDILVKVINDISNSDKLENHRKIDIKFPTNPISYKSFIKFRFAVFWEEPRFGFDVFEIYVYAVCFSGFGNDKTRITYKGTWRKPPLIKCHLSFSVMRITDPVTLSEYFRRAIDQRLRN